MTTYDASTRFTGARAAFNRYPGHMTAETSVAAPPAPVPPQAQGWVYPYPQSSPASPPPVPPQGPDRGKLAMWIAMGVCGVVTVGALVLSGIALNKASQAEATAGGSTTVTAAPQNAQLFEDEADLSLCKAIPDLMRERNAAEAAFQATPADSPERRAAIPGFKSGTEAWAKRMQAVINDHATPDRYLTRTLQRYVDDVLLYSQNIYPGKPADSFDTPTWNTAIVSYGGALGRCNELGVRWQ
ncbi:Uncharacterised protein [Mycobacteroides abscessus subsp. abscessus]|nr:Uncharacterised protein [Mycobacteroides abscessus subsp. abscessus]SLC55855.1 Uncharacterised protein [Mycobacteroides abscessus subsp. massiliense]BBZ85260.1 hypothetical protein MABM_51760 [Mycobacteroides abscessus]SIL55349.1 Uncharacterised protein [Mycobacteroides abscessus subsp. abscessus]SIM44462.1 Uncharacterised protein [Mycobacteroides abscessus subsp. abscessus]